MGSLRGRGGGGRDGVRREGGRRKREKQLRDGGMEGWRDGGMEGWRDRGREEKEGKEEGMMVQPRVKGNKYCYCEGELTWGRGCQ